MTLISEQNIEESMRKTSVQTLKKMIEAYSGVTVDIIKKKKAKKSKKTTVKAHIKKKVSNADLCPF